MTTCHNTLKQCIKCEESLPLESFVKDKRNKDGRGARCRSCTYASKQYNPERQRRYKLKHFYGITPDEYSRLLDEQGGVCQICKCPPEENGAKNLQALRVDHCHETGKIRGLLCHNCNVAIGHLGDNLSTMQNAISYLAKYA
jgi:Recombination endonuclease VII